jgi:4-hydroxy-2-oxoheptanedioate aldolase
LPRRRVPRIGIAVATGGTMDIPTNRFKRALKDGRRQIGLWSTLSSNYTVEVIAGAGFDWIMIDTEHSPTDLESVLGQLQAAAPYDTTPVVRVPWNDMVTIKRYLDLGVQTLLIPQVACAQEARNAVAYTRYPPAGFRGVAGATRATRFGRVKDYFKAAQAEICVVVQIESAEGLENLEAIAAVDGIDGVFVGPADLHASLGYLGERAHEEVMPRIDEAIVRIVKSGKAAGILADGEVTARRWLALGALFVAVGSDLGLLARGAEALAAAFSKDRA